MRFFFTLILCLIASAAHAADVSFVFPEFVAADGTGVMQIVLDTEGEAVNVVSANILFPERFEPIALRTGESVFSIWIEEPVLEGNRLTFVGAIPNGLSDNHIPLLSLVFSAPLSGEDEPVGGSVSVFTNASQPAQLEARVPSSMSWVLASSSVPSVVDRIPPEPFTVSVVSEEEFFDGQFVAIFSAVDKQSGIDYFEVQEHETEIPDPTAWKRAESPAVLSSDAENRYVSVKAVDRSGNVYITTVPPKHKSSLAVALLIVGILGFCGLFYALFKRKRV